jgi:hypothetical protein
VLALGLEVSPGLGLRPGRSVTRGPPALALLGHGHTSRMLPPSPGATPATRSTSMILLTGRPRLPRALPPATGRREVVTCLAQPWASGTHPQPLHSHRNSHIHSRGSWEWSEGAHLFQCPGSGQMLPDSDLCRASLNHCIPPLVTHGKVEPTVDSKTQRELVGRLRGQGPESQGCSSRMSEGPRALGAGGILGRPWSQLLICQGFPAPAAWPHLCLATQGSCPLSGILPDKGV